MDWSVAGGHRRRSARHYRSVENGSRIRSLAKAGAFAAGGAAGAAAATVGLLAAQTEQAKKTIGPRTTAPPFADARYGRSKGPSIRLVMIGDSVAAGLGADHAFDTIGARLANIVSEYDGRAVVLSTVATVGARSKNLDEQVTRALHYRPHVAVIIIGANDATHLVPKNRSIAYLRAALRRLRAANIQVVVGTTPDMGKIVPIQPPLRWALQAMGNRIAEAQTICVVEEGCRAVSMGQLLGPEFGLRPRELFAADQFHPSTEGYEAVAQALAPSVLAALSRGEKGEVLPDRFELREEAPLDEVAHQAAHTSGMEVVATEDPDTSTSRWSRLAKMGRRKLPPRQG